MPETIGDRLKSTREERRLSREQASLATRIKEKYFEALENNRMDLLPSDVQGRGFLRLYASYLDIPVQPLLEAWTNGGVIAAPPTSETPLGVASLHQPPIEETSSDKLPAFEIKEILDAELLPVSITDSGRVPVSSADEIFKEIGAELKKRREVLGLKFADIEGYTLIRQHYLEALEQGRFRDLPSLVQARGMLNNYARFLEMDSENLLLKFASALQQQRLAAQLSGNAARSEQIHPKKAAFWKMFLTPDLMIGAVLIIGLLGFLLWGISQITASQAVEKNSNNLIALPESFLTTQDVLITATFPQLEPTRNPEANTQPAPVEEIEPTGTVQPDDALNLAPLQINIIASQRAYLRIIAVGKTVFNSRVVPGNAYSFSAQTRIELLTGNASALQVFFNQNDLGVLGVVGEVVARVFTISGVATPTPQFSPTPTETLPPTLTMVPSPTIVTPTVTPFIP